MCAYGRRPRVPLTWSTLQADLWRLSDPNTSDCRARSAPVSRKEGSGRFTWARSSQTDSVRRNHFAFDRARGEPLRAAG